MSMHDFDYCNQGNLKHHTLQVYLKVATNGYKPKYVQDTLNAVRKLILCNILSIFGYAIRSP